MASTQPHEESRAASTLAASDKIDEKENGVSNGTYTLDGDNEKAKDMTVGTEAAEEREEHEDSEKAQGIRAEGAPLEQVVSSDYPKTGKLVMVLVAVSLSIFLVALDMVR